MKVNKKYINVQTEILIDCGKELAPIFTNFAFMCISKGYTGLFDKKSCA